MIDLILNEWIWGLLLVPLSIIAYLFHRRFCYHPIGRFVLVSHQNKTLYKSKWMGHRMFYKAASNLLETLSNPSIEYAEFEESNRNSVVLSKKLLTNSILYFKMGFSYIDKEKKEDESNEPE